MTCAWKARPASSGTRRRLAAWCLGLLALAPAVVYAQADDPEDAPVVSAVRPWPPRLEMVDAGPLADDLRRQMTADRAWLRSQRAGPVQAPTDSSALVTWLAAAAKGQAAPDSAASDEAPLRGRRDLLSLLRSRWLERGHLAAEVTVADAGAGDRPARIVVSPGPLFRIGSIAVEGEDFPGRARILDVHAPRAGDVFVPSDYLDAAADVVATCAERGFPFPIWMTREMSADAAAGEVAITAVLVPGPRAVIGPQTSTLPHGRGQDFLVRAAGLRTGAPFRESDLRRGRDRLLARDLYEQVDEPLVHLSTARDTVGVRWRVTPVARPNRINVVLGLSRREEGGTRLSGQVDLDLPNLAGTGRRLAANWSDDGQDRSRFGFAYLEPLVLGTPLDTDVALENEVLADSYTRFSVENRWRLPVVSLWGIEAGVGWDRTTYPAGDLEATRRLRGRLAVLHSRGDRSRSGWSGAFAVETASRSATPRSVNDGEGAGGSLGSQETQRLLEGDLAGELWLSRTLSLAGRASFRQIAADTRPAPLPEQYRFGGANTLRGYREDEFHGETAAWGGVEVRLGRAWRSRVYTFVDVGYFEFSVRETVDGEERLARRTGEHLGYGLGLMTDGAPGRINLAVGFPGSVDFQTAKLHVSLLGSF
jgi:outer membrane protein assembly factor BamA